jgi:MFS superfamily sulfate permease-like transporter
LKETMDRSPLAAKADEAGSPAVGRDVIAGLVATAVVIPKAMAYATVAGLPVAVGLYTAFVPMALYALAGSSRVLSVSSTTTLAILTATQLGLVVPDGDPAKLVTATAALTALIGVMRVVAGLVRLGFVANFISTPVLTGFKAGSGLVIVLDQLPKVLGVHITKQGFFRDLFQIAHHIPETSLIVLAVAAATFAILIGMERLWPHSPAPLVAVGGAIAASWFFGLQARGVSIVGVIPRGLPALTLPDVSLLEQLVPGALRLAETRNDRPVGNIGDRLGTPRDPVLRVASMASQRRSYEVDARFPTGCYGRATVPISLPGQHARVANATLSDARPPRHARRYPG